jgi:hypothetical protein
MNTVNYEDKGAITDSTYVGVDNNRLVVTTRPEDYGTFAVTTNETYTTIPHSKAKSFRINNLTGKMVGIRRRHKTILVDNLDDLDYMEWSGSGIIEKASEVIEGVRTAKITGLKYRPLTTEQMNDGSEVEITFRTPSTEEYNTSVAVWDSAVRVTTPSANPAAIFTATNANTTKDTLYKVIFRLRPTLSKYDVILEGSEREEVTSDADGQFGTNNMTESVVSVNTDTPANVDPIFYQQKVNFTHELMFSTSSYTFPCQDNISEYEVINLGSDAMGYSDNTDSITLTGFYVA